MGKVNRLRPVARSWSIRHGQSINEVLDVSSGETKKWAKGEAFESKRGKSAQNSLLREQRWATESLVWNKIRGITWNL